MPVLCPPVVSEPSLSTPLSGAQVTGQDLPVVKHTLGEGLAACVGPQVSGEAKGL